MGIVESETTRESKARPAPAVEPPSATGELPLVRARRVDTEFGYGGWPFHLVWGLSPVAGTARHRGTIYGAHRRRLPVRPGGTVIRRRPRGSHERVR